MTRVVIEAMNHILTWYTRQAHMHPFSSLSFLAFYEPSDSGKTVEHVGFRVRYGIYYRDEDASSLTSDKTRPSVVARTAMDLVLLL